MSALNRIIDAFDGNPKDNHNDDMLTALDNIADVIESTGGNVPQPDWEQTTTTAKDYIKNKPPIKQYSKNGGILESNATEASGVRSHAEGDMTVASGWAAHAEGNQTVASGAHSHAEGEGTEASGRNSHAEGSGTIAKCYSQHVFGEYNEEDPSNGSIGQYIEIVGNGDGFYDRSNARTLDWNGNESLAGSITLGKDTADEATLSAAQLKQLLALLN